MHDIHGTYWLTYFKPIKIIYKPIKTSQSIPSANQLTDFCTSGMLILNWLGCDHSVIKNFSFNRFIGESEQ